MEAERQHYNVTLAILTLAGIAFALQQTMVIPALPTLQRDLHTTTTWVTWVLTVFLLVASVATPILGKLGDQYGKERLLVISLALFFIGSVGAAAAWNIWSLIGWRAVQGAGAAVFPLSYGIIRDEFPREKVGVAIGLVSAVFGIGGGFGIVLSGVIVDHVSWRWLFIVGAVGIGASLVLVHRFIPESPIKTPSRVDYLGATLMSGGLIAMLVALTEGESWGWTSGRTLGLAAAAVVLLLAWGIAELHVDDPMVDMRMRPGARSSSRTSQRSSRGSRCSARLCSCRTSSRCRTASPHRCGTLWTTASTPARRRRAFICCRARSPCSLQAPSPG